MILVLGGAGYIGSHTVRALVEAGRDVVVIDDLSTGHREAVPQSVRLYTGDIRDGAFLDSVLERERPEAIIHFAARSLVGESMKKPLEYYDNNVRGTLSVLEAMLRNGVNNIVFSSSAAAYGEPKRVPIEEDDPKAPTNPYGETKLAVERMLKWVRAAHGIRYASLRYFNACGAHPSGEIGEAHSPETHLMPLVLNAALGRSGALSVFGDDYDTPDGTCLRDYIHVSDLASAHILAVDALLSGNAGGCFNLGIGKAFSVLEVIEAAERVTGKRVPAVRAVRRAGDPAVLLSSNERAMRELKWTPRVTTVDEMLLSAFKWHESHPDGYGSLTQA